MPTSSPTTTAADVSLDTRPVGASPRLASASAPMPTTAAAGSACEVAGPSPPGRASLDDGVGGVAGRRRDRG